MAHPDPSVRERIIRQLLATLRDEFGEELGPANIQRFDGENNQAVEVDRALPAAWMVLTAADDDVDNEEFTTGLTAKVMPVTVDVHLMAPPPTGMTIDEYGNAWAARVEAALMSDPYVTEEASSKELAHQMLVIECFYPEAYDKQRDNIAGCTIELRFDHVEGDPWTGRADL